MANHEKELEESNLKKLLKLQQEIEQKQANQPAEPETADIDKHGFQATVDRIKANRTLDPEDTDNLPGHLKPNPTLTISGAAITHEAEKLQGAIASKPEKPEQIPFSFMPLPFTRVSPFYPMGKKELGKLGKDRPQEIFEWSHSWGKVIVRGEKLSTDDEALLLSATLLARKYDSIHYYTSWNELCSVMGKTPGGKVYQALIRSYERLMTTSVKIYYGSKKKDNIPNYMGTFFQGLSTEINEPTDKSRGRPKNRIHISLNRYYWDLFGKELPTSIDVQFFVSLKLPTARALYRFYRGQSLNRYPLHLKKLAGTINLDPNKPPSTLKKIITPALKELEAKGFLTKFLINKMNTVIVWGNKKAIPDDVKQKQIEAKKKKEKDGWQA